MKSYYHAHEFAYQQIKSKGYVGWGNSKTLSDLGDKKTNFYLKEITSKFFTTFYGKKALDVGCGTGTTAFLLAKLGFEVTGIDISETALQMGKEFALQQDLKINFTLADILKLDNSLGKFDLIYDSHCLHCIVFEEDRATTLANIKKSLNAEGVFILDTMVMPTEKINFAEGTDSLRFDEDFILWHKTGPSNDYGIVKLNEQYWCAQRRIYPAEKVMNEVKRAEFKILSEQIDEEFGKPSMLRLVLE